jgi:hypothetical protein
MVKVVNEAPRNLFNCYPELSADIEALALGVSFR